MDIDPQMRLELLEKEITLEETLKDENNVLQQLDYPRKDSGFWRVSRRIRLDKM